MKNSKVYYETIYECPISEWDLAKTYFNNAFLKKENISKIETEVEKDNSEEGNKIFLSLLDQIWLKFGQDEKTKEIIEIKKELIELYSEMIQEDEKFNINFIEPLEFRLAELEKKGDIEYKFSDEVGVVGKNFGSLINPKKVSIYEYYSASSALKNG